MLIGLPECGSRVLYYRCCFCEIVNLIEEYVSEHHRAVFKISQCNWYYIITEEAKLVNISGLLCSENWRK